jgi:hypothetical protein
MRGVRAFHVALVACVSGCSGSDAVFQDPAQARGYRLVGAYDASTLRTTEKSLPEDLRPRAYEYIWAPAPRMIRSCGPTKAPDGLGIFESEAIANRAMPTLALVVERQGEVPPLDTQRVRVALGFGEPSFFVEPAVQPRYIQVAIEGAVSTRFKQQIKTQLQTFLCMEHKTGRAWQGGELDQVRQALLLNPPDDFRLPDRKFFGGQNEPVAALLGPPETCLKRSPDFTDAAGGRGGRGDTSLNLVPSDVWGASIDRCDDNIRPGGLYVGPRPLELRMSEDVVDEGVGTPRTWSELKIALNASSELPTGQMVEVSYQGSEFIEAGPDADGKGVLITEQPLFVEEENGTLGLVDIVSKIPYRYPTVGDTDDTERYTVLLIPNWQLVEGIRRLYAKDVSSPRANAGQGVQDGVGWILEHPEHLYLMVPRDPAEYDHLDTGKEIEWLNIAKVMAPGYVRDFGYATGMLAGRSPIALPGVTVPTWDQVVMAQRAIQQSIFLGSVTLLFVFVAAGLGRVRDLWTRVPEERVEFWPGPPQEEQGSEDDMADLSKGEEEEK